MTHYWFILKNLYLHIFLGFLASCISSFVVAESSSVLTRLTVKGSYYEIGFQVGRQFQEYIKQYYEEHPKLHSVWLPWSNTPEGQKILESFKATTRKYFPGYIQELQGMAHGANIPFIEMFLVSYSNELYVLTSNSSRDEADSCTDILSNHPEDKTIIIGHNEDNSPLIQNKSYIITATVVEGSDILEQFTAYCYPGVLPGNAFGFNSHGIITTVNGLYPKSVLKEGVGRSYVNRAMLAANNLQDIISRASTPGSYGFSCNIGILGGASNNDAHLYNIEVAPDVEDQRTQINVLEVLPSSEKTKHSSLHNTSFGNYFHVNMYRRFVLPQISDKIISSVHRTTRIQQYPQPRTIDEVKKILGDTKDTKYPIYRTPRSTDNETTLATAVFDLRRCVMYVYTDRPSSSAGPLFIIDLPCTTKIYD